MPKAFREGTVAERAALAVSTAMVVLGIWLRCRAVATAPMWLDEAAWTVRLVKDPLRELVIRPIGFMYIERELSGVFGPSEAVVRFLPWLAGVICALISVPLARRLFRSEAARLLFVGIITLDPNAIDFSKEFKPYSISLTIHAGLLLLVLRYAATRKARDLAWVLSVSLFGVLFAQDAIFAYPGVFLCVLVDALHARRWRHLLATTLVAALTVTLIGCLYVYFWSTMNQSKEEHAWGKKYDTFYLSGGTKADWMLGRYAELAETPATRHVGWTLRNVSQGKLDELGALYGACFLVLNLAGMTQLVRGRQWRKGVLLLLPLGVMATFNWLGFWPFGPFRANLFTLVYVGAVACAAVDRQPRSVRWADFAPVVLLILLPLFAFERKWHATKPLKMSSHFPDALRTLIRLYGPPQPGHKEMLVADAYSCPMYNYYVKYHPGTSKTLGQEMHERFTINCHSDRVPTMFNAARNSLHAPSDRAWMIVSRLEHFDKLTKPFSGDMRLFTSRNVSGLHRILGLEKARQEPSEDASQEAATP